RLATATKFETLLALLRSDDTFALLHRAIKTPPQMRRGAAPRPPRFRDRGHLLRVRTGLKLEADADRFLHGEVAGGPGIAMTKAEQQIDVGRPRADAVQGCQRAMCGVGLFLRKDVQVEPIGREFACNGLQCLDLGGGEPEASQPIGARAAAGMM